MHEQHEEQPFNSLPDLSTWHRVPAGATIPKGTPYAYTYADDFNITVRLDGCRYDTTVDHGPDRIRAWAPITPPLPTEEGATIVVSYDDRPPRVLLELQDGRWITRYGDKFAVDQIRAWAPVTVGEVVVVS